MAQRTKERRRPWQRQLREQILVALEDIRQRLPKIDFSSTRKADTDALGDLVEDLERLAEEIAETRCWKCGCSFNDPCPGGCSWVSYSPALCSACA